MPVSVQTPSNTYTGNGSNAVFTYTFFVIDAADLKVYVNGVLVADADYTVAGIGLQIGGSVTFDTAPINGATVYLRREVILNRETDYQQGGALNSQTLDDDIDRIVMMVQDLNASTLIAAEGVADLDAQNKRITNVADPVDAQDAATKAWVNTTTAASAAIAAGAATNAQASEVAAAASAAAALVSQNAAAGSAGSANTSASNASGSASAASSSASAASGSASSASGSASTATTQASNALASANAADISEANALASASAASISEVAAEAAESNAAGWASTASSWNTLSQAAANASAASFDSFDDRYLGSKASDPTLDNDGNALLQGALYWNSTSDVLKVYEGAAWLAASVSPASHYTKTETDAAYAPITRSRKNYLINGCMRIWQRKNNQTTSDIGSSDRWTQSHSLSTKTHTRQPFDLGQTAVPGNPRWYARTLVVDGAGTSRWVASYQRIEYVPTLSGKTVTLSFWAKADASKNIVTSFAQNFGTGGTPSAQVGPAGYVKTHALTTTWTKFTHTLTLPSVSGKTLGTTTASYTQVTFWLNSGSDYDVNLITQLQQSGTFDIASIQVEEGSEATTFEYRPEEEELMLCQYYYQKSFDIADYPANNVGAYSVFGSSYSGTVIRAMIPFVQRMRAAPTMTFFRSTSGTVNGQWSYYVAGWQPCATTAVLVTESHCIVSLTDSGFTARDCHYLTGCWEADAEF